MNEKFGLVDEQRGGIIAYFFDIDIAQELAQTLNGDERDPEKARYWVDDWAGGEPEIDPAQVGWLRSLLADIREGHMQYTGPDPDAMAECLANVGELSRGLTRLYPEESVEGTLTVWADDTPL